MPSAPLRYCAQVGCNMRVRSGKCKRHGGRCPFEGARDVYSRMPEHVRQAVLARDGRRCTLCGSTKQLEVDHIIPQSRGGPHTVENGRVLCRRCHLRVTGETHGQAWRRRR
jgi:5-methylcytosine-specific restriction endonuclease McrA